MRIQIDGQHVHHARGILLVELHARHQTPMHDDHLSQLRDLAHVQDDGASVEPLHLFIGQLARECAIPRILPKEKFWADVAVRVGRERIRCLHVVAEQEHPVFMVPAHTGGGVFAGEVDDPGAVGALVDHVAGEDEVVALVVKGDFVEKEFHCPRQLVRHDKKKIRERGKVAYAHPCSHAHPR